MAADNEKLWIIEYLFPHAHLVFRTRAAARKYAKDKGWPPNEYAIHRATWGPEQ